MHATVPTVKIKPSHPSQGAFVEINASDFDPEKHERIAEIPPPPPAPPLPPPPPPPVDPLAAVVAAQDWREWDFGRLRDVALAAGGRSPETGTQAVQIIEKLLAKRSK